MFGNIDIELIGAGAIFLISGILIGIFILIYRICRNDIRREYYPFLYMPENEYFVEMKEGLIICKNNSKQQTVKTDSLKRVVIETNDLGPSLPDMFFILKDDVGKCVIPQGATGEERLWELFKSLEGFDHGQVIEASMSVENKRFVCRERK